MGAFVRKMTCSTSDEVGRGTLPQPARELVPVLHVVPPLLHQRTDAVMITASSKSHARIARMNTVIETSFPQAPSLPSHSHPTKNHARATSPKQRLHIARC